jgi:hypothetical protein
VNKVCSIVFVTAWVAIAAQHQSPASGGAQNGPQGSAQTQPAQTSNQASNQTSGQKPRRVSAKLDGFDLAPEAVSANQTGGASRSAAPGGPKPIPYAPHKGRVFTLRPSFSWQGTPGTAYKFHIQDVTGQFVWDRTVNGTTLDYPADAPPLEPGKTYIWRVHPDSPMLGGAAPPAMIVVLDEQERSELEAAAASQDEAARARLYFDHRLWYDAVMAYSDLIAKHPEDAKLYLIRGSLYEQLPATQALADKDFAHAN